MRYVVLIWIRSGMRNALHAYEEKVVPIMARHGGHFDAVIDVSDVNNESLLSGGKPDEAHVLSFPDANAFARWREDPDMQALVPQRDAAVAQVLFLSGRALSQFEDS